MRVLMELRPALDGHAGIPQEARLLFRGLLAVPEIEVLGLLQSNNLVLEPGLPVRGGRAVRMADKGAEIDALSRVVSSLQQGPAAHRFEHWRKRILRVAGPLMSGAGTLLGARVGLSAFEPEHFKDFVWRSLFAKTLPSEDFGAVTQAEYRILRWSWSGLNALGVATGALGHALYPRLDTRGIDVLIAETPYPARVSAGTQLIVRYHDAIPLLMPHTIKDRGYHRAMHFHALRRNARDGAWFACVSDATRADLLSVLPEVEERTVTIPNMIPHHFGSAEEPADRVPEIIWSRKNRRAPHEGGRGLDEADLAQGGLPYLLMVSTVEPRKNHLALLDAWELLRARGHPRLNLICVGSLGWDHEAIMRRFSPWLARGGLHLLEDVPAADLRLLYRHAQATVCPSFHEGFDFSGVEAMRSGGVVVASDIPVHREVFGEAAVHCTPYSAEQMAQTIADLLSPDAEPKRAAMRAEGQRVASRYDTETVLPQWERLLDTVGGSTRRRSQ